MSEREQRDERLGRALADLETPPPGPGFWERGELGIGAEELALASRRFDYVSPDELRALAAAGCRIEAHGHVHRYPKGDTLAFANDLRRCMDEITALGLPRPRHYCYPSGRFDAGASAVLEEAGVVSGTTCASGLADPARSRDFHYLPRLLDGENVTRIEFEAEMSGFSTLARRYLLEPLASLRARLSSTHQEAKSAPAHPAS